MKVLVTGGAGFIGSQIVRAHVSEGHSVHVVDDLSTGSTDNLPEDIEMVCTNVGSGSLDHIMPWQWFDRVYHFASPASPDAFASQWRIIVEANVVGALSVCNLVRPGGTLIVASSSEAYGQPRGSMSEENLGSVRTQSVRGVYDESKRLLESIAYSAAPRLAVRSLVLRIFNTYGPGMPDDGRVINTFLRQAAAGEGLTLHGDGSQTRSFAYVTDTVSQILTLTNLVEERETIGTCQVFNVGSPDERTVIQAAQIVSGLTGAPIVQMSNPRPNDPVWRRADMSKTAEYLGGLETLSLEEGVSLCVL